MARLSIGLVYDLLGTHPRDLNAPADADVEYEPEATLLALEGAIRTLGHEPVRLGAPHALLDAIGSRALPRVDAAWNIAEGYGGRNREAWAPVLLEMAGVPALGSDALTLSATLDKEWARSRVAAAGGTVAKTVDESVSYVVLGDTMADGSPVECSASYQNAQRLGIKLMSEQEFFAML